MYQLVRSPGEFMEQKAGQPKIRTEVLTVLLVGFLGSLGAIYVTQEALAFTDSDTAQITAIGLALEPIFGAVVLWIGYTLGLHALARYFDGRGVLRRLLKTTAWALIPLGVGNLLRSGAVYVLYQGIDIAAVVEEGSDGGAVEAVAQAGAGEPLYLVGQILLLLGVLGSGYLMVYAVQTAKDLDRKPAIRAVAVPLSVHVLYLLWTTVQAVGIAG